MEDIAGDGINGYGTSLAGCLSQTSGQSITADMLTVVLTPIGIICCLAGFIFTSLVMRFGTKIVAVIACYGMGRLLHNLGFAGFPGCYLDLIVYDQSAGAKGRDAG